MAAMPPATPSSTRGRPRARWSRAAVLGLGLLAATHAAAATLAAAPAAAAPPPQQAPALLLMGAPPPAAALAILAASLAAALARCSGGSGGSGAPAAHRRALLVLRTAAALCAAAVVAVVARRIAEAAAVGAVSIVRFSQYLVAGGVCALLTHAACTPIDVVKTRIQTTQGKYAGLLDGTRKIVAEEGPSALLKGLGATAGGYFLHGAFKFSFYEVFKVILSPTPTAALKPPMAIAALAGFGAECIACLLLCPMEAVRIRSVADHTFPSGVLPGLVYIHRTEGTHGLYKGLPAMMLKQVPYTVGQFVSYEFFVVAVRSAVVVLLVAPDAMLSGSMAGFVSAVAGLLAGVAAAIVSHPGDTILSRVNQEQGDGGDAFAHIHRVVRAAGLRGLFSGLSVRIIQVACMIGGQFLIYDTIKLMCGIVPASALSEIPPAVISAGMGAAMLKGGAPLVPAGADLGNVASNFSSVTGRR